MKGMIFMKKWITAAGAVLLAAVLLTACGRDGAVSSGKAVSSAASAEVSSEGTAALPAESSTESLPEASSAVTSSKAASSKKPSSSAAAKPSKPSVPAKPADLIATDIYAVANNDYTWFLDASGALYNFYGEKRTSPHEKGYEYAVAKQVDSNVALRRSFWSVEYKIDKKGTLYAKGSLPKDNAKKSGLYTDTEPPFIDSHMYTEKNWKKVMDNAADVQHGFILDKKGDLYVYGAIRMRYNGNSLVAEVCATPKKLRGGVKAVCGADGCNSVTVLTTDDKLVTLGDITEYDRNKVQPNLSNKRTLQTETLIADNVRAADRKGPYYYITKNNELYVWGSFLTAGGIYDPQKIAGNVKEAAVSYFGYSYLTTDNQLYTFGDQQSDLDITLARPVAKNVKSFAFAGTLLYIDNQNQLHGYGLTSDNIRGFSSELEGPDNIILKDVARMVLGADNAFCQQFDGSIYVWGKNIISCQRCYEGIMQNMLTIPNPTKVN